MKLISLMLLGGLTLALLVFCSSTARAQGIVFQEFYWDTAPPAGQSWWAHVEGELPALADAGVRAVWVPAPTKGGAGPYDMGYGPYDPYDLGDKDQKGTVATRFGTKDEFMRFVAEAHRNGIKVYADAVLNHAMGADYAEPNPVMARLGWNDIPDQSKIKPEQRSLDSKPGDLLRSWTGFAPKGADGKTGSGRFPRTWRDFHPNEAEPDRNGPYHQKEFGEDYAFRGDNDTVRKSFIAWSQWFTAQTGVDGYRLDDVKGMEPDFIHDFVTGSDPKLWAVGEYLDGDPAKVMGYLHETGDALHLFDYPLYFAIRDLTFRPESNSMKDLLNRRMPDREHAVTFVGNHDMSRTDSAIVYNPVWAQALILAMSGTPCVYYSDFWRAGPAQREQFTRLMRLHDRLTVGEEIIRQSSQTTLVIERRGHLLAAFNSGGDAEAHTLTVTTAFAPGSRLRDWAGAGKPVTVDAQGQVSLRIEPYGFAYYAPADAPPAPPRVPIETRQTWEFADDLATGRLSGTPHVLSVTLRAGATLEARADAEPGVTVRLGVRDAAGKMVGEGNGSVKVTAARGGEYKVTVQTGDGRVAGGRVTLRY